MCHPFATLLQSDMLQKVKSADKNEELAAEAQRIETQLREDAARQKKQHFEQTLKVRRLLVKSFRPTFTVFTSQQNQTQLLWQDPAHQNQAVVRAGTASAPPLCCEVMLHIGCNLMSTRCCWEQVLPPTEEKYMLVCRSQAKERAAVKAGKKPFFLKKSAKRRAELVAKYEDLKKAGRLEKYLAKRRRKNAAKDHRYIPRPGGRD